MAKKIQREIDKDDTNSTEIPCITGKFVTCCKVSDLLTIAIEIEVFQGVVISIVYLQKAGDLAAISMGRAQSALWEAMREQKYDAMMERDREG